MAERLIPGLFPITMENYWLGRNIKYSMILSTSLQAKARLTVELANQCLEEALHYGVLLEASPVTGCLVTSGWRPAVENAKVAGAAPKSLHISCEAIDIYDPEGCLDDFLLEHHSILSSIGLWMEHPSATKTWCHLQTRPPRSGKRVFYP